MTLFYLLKSVQAQEGANQGTFWLPPAASTLAEGVDYTFYFIYWVSAFFFVVLMGAMLWFALAYKKKSDDDRTLDLKGSHTIEIAWATLPSFLLIAMFVMGFTNYVKSTVPPAESLHVRVNGWQWDWAYTYPSLGGFTTKDLVVPDGKPVRLQMLSKDVLHSFFVPDFRIKKDVLPNRYTTQWFETVGMFEGNTVYTKDNNYTNFEKKEGSEALGTSDTIDVANVVAGQCKKQKEMDPSFKCTDDASKVKTAQHQVFCTEYCGDSHSRMLSKVVVLAPEDFELWVKGMRNFDPYEKFKTTAEVGKYLYSKVGCNGCHGLEAGAAGTGPSWYNIWDQSRPGSGDSGKVDENYLRASILQPQAYIVPGYEGAKMNGGWEDVLSEKDIDSIIEFIKSLK
jgi:cytochrome c oxidase subunit 2